MGKEVKISDVESEAHKDFPRSKWKITKILKDKNPYSLAAKINKDLYWVTFTEKEK